MGWVSMSEDIEEIRNQRAHFRKGLAGIRSKVRKTRSSADLKKVEPDIRAQQESLTRFLQEVEERVLAVFDAAERRLRDPRVNLVRRLDKKVGELDAVRATLAEREHHLLKCRAARAEFQQEVEALRAENKRLILENTKLRDNELAWAQEVGQVRPIKKR
jgi:hypothetical protein